MAEDGASTGPIPSEKERLHAEFKRRLAKLSLPIRLEAERRETFRRIVWSKRPDWEERDKDCLSRRNLLTKMISYEVLLLVWNYESCREMLIVDAQVEKFLNRGGITQYGLAKAITGGIDNPAMQNLVQRIVQAAESFSLLDRVAEGSKNLLRGTVLLDELMRSLAVANCALQSESSMQPQGTPI